MKSTDGREQGTESIVSQGDMSVRDALNVAIRQNGLRVLRSPNEIRGYLLDLCDPSSIDVVVLVRNCDDELLKPFADAVETGDANAIELARSRAERLLVDERYERADAAKSISGALAESISSWSGINVSPKRPAQQAPRAVQQAASNEPKPSERTSNNSRLAELESSVASMESYAKEMLRRRSAGEVLGLDDEDFLKNYELDLEEIARLRSGAQEEASGQRPAGGAPAPGARAYPTNNQPRSAEPVQPMREAQGRVQATPDTSPNADTTGWHGNELTGLAYANPAHSRAAEYRPLPERGSGIVAVAEATSVARGHRGDTGSHLAVAVAVRRLESFAAELAMQGPEGELTQRLRSANQQREVLDKLSADIVEGWNRAVLDHASAFPERTLTGDVRSFYGANLLSVLMTPGFMITLRMGRGLVTRLQPSGVAYTALTKSAPSLASANSQSHMQAQVFNRMRKRIVAVYIASNGSGLEEGREADQSREGLLRMANCLSDPRFGGGQLNKYSDATRLAIEQLATCGMVDSNTAVALGCIVDVTLARSSKADLQRTLRELVSVRRERQESPTGRGPVQQERQRTPTGGGLTRQATGLAGFTVGQTQDGCASAWKDLPLYGGAIVAVAEATKRSREKRGGVGARCATEVAMVYMEELALMLASTQTRDELMSKLRSESQEDHREALADTCTRIRHDWEEAIAEHAHSLSGSPKTRVDKTLYDVDLTAAVLTRDLLVSVSIGRGFIGCVKGDLSTTFACTRERSIVDSLGTSGPGKAPAILVVDRRRSGIADILIGCDSLLAWAEAAFESAGDRNREAMLRLTVGLGALSVEGSRPQNTYDAAAKSLLETSGVIVGDGVPVAAGLVDQKLAKQKAPELKEALGHSEQFSAGTEQITVEREGKRGLSKEHPALFLFLLLCTFLLLMWVLDVLIRY